MLDLTGDVLILALRATLLGILYLFLLAVVRVVGRDMRATATRDPDERAELVVVDPGESALAPGQRIALRGRTTFGRAATSVVVLDDFHVSGAHAVLLRQNGTWMLADAGSTNGTWLNGRPITGTVTVTDDDEIMIGSVRLRASL